MNPTGEPFGAPPPTVNARAALNIPGILIIVLGALGVLMSLKGLVTPVTADMDTLREMLTAQGQSPEAIAFAEKVLGMVKVLYVVGIIVYGVILFGGVQMRQLKMRPLAIASAFLVMAPCSWMCCLGLPVGIWALVTLFKAEVAQQFT